MDAARFDAIAQTLAKRSRRTVLRSLAGAAASLIPLSGTSHAQARKPKKNRCRNASRPDRCGKGKNSICTNLDVDNEHCGNCQTACSAPETCQNGTCQRVVSCDDGCSDTCECIAPATCGGGGTPGTCGVPPDDCTPTGAACDPLAFEPTCCSKICQRDDYNGLSCPGDIPYCCL